MRTLLSRAIQVDPSFHIGLSLIVILAVAEIFAATLYYVGRARAARVSTQSVAAAVARPPAPSVSARSPAPVAVQPEVAQAPAIPNPSESLVDQLVREGVELRDRRDTTTALKRFDEALDSEPDNTAVLMEKAKTYDSIQLYDRSNEVWRKIKEVSPPDSTTYELADRRLKLGVSSSPPAEAGNTSGAVDAAAPQDAGGRPEGPLKGIPEVKTAEAKVLPETADSGNTWGTSFRSITTMICKRCKRSRRGFYSIFLLRRIRVHNDTIGHYRARKRMSLAAICMGWPKLKRILPCACVLLFATAAKGQIQVDLKFKRLQYIAYEPVVATLGISNLAGRDIELQDANG